MGTLDGGMSSVRDSAAHNHRGMGGMQNFYSSNSEFQKLGKNMDEENFQEEFTHIHKPTVTISLPKALIWGSPFNEQDGACKSTLFNT